MNLDGRPLETSLAPPENPLEPMEVADAVSLEAMASACVGRPFGANVR